MPGCTLNKRTFVRSDLVHSTDQLGAALLDGLRSFRRLLELVPNTEEQNASMYHQSQYTEAI